MDLESFRAAGYRTVDRICDYFHSLEQQPVAAQVPRGYLAAALPAEAPVRGEPWADVERDYDTHILPGMTHWQHPMFFGFFPSNVTYEGILADMYCAATTNPGFNWAASPAVTELEFHMLDWVARMLGLGAAFLSSDATHRGGGVIHGSASEACLTVAIAARDRALRQLAPTGPGAEEQRRELLPRLVIYGTTQTHAIGAKSAMMLGLRFRALDVYRQDDYALQGSTLRAALDEDIARGLHPFLLVSSYGTTNSCAIDDLPAVAAVAAAYPQLWLHVDAAYGGVTLCLPEERLGTHLDAINAHAHSFSTNLHKWGLVQLDCSPTFVRDRQWLVDALTLTPEYLKSKGAAQCAEMDLRNLQIVLGRRFRALRVWFVLRSFGQDGFRRHLRNSIRLAQRFAAEIVDGGVYELVNPPRWGLVMFRMRTAAGAEDARNRALGEVIGDRSAELLLTPTVLPEVGYCFRFVVGSPHTDEAHVDKAVPPRTPLNRTDVTPVAFLLRAALVRPNKVAVVHPEGGYWFTYAQWAARVLSLAFALQGVPGWRRGERVAVLSPNVPLIADAHYGVLAAGGIITPLNYRNSAREVEYILAHAEVRVVLVDYEFAHLVPKTLPDGVTVVVSRDSGGRDPADAYEAFLMTGHAAWSARQADAMLRDPDAIAAGNSDWGLLAPATDEDATCALCYTSGTTGRPKGVELTFRGCYIAALSNALETQLTGDTVYLWVLPMFHCCGWTFPWAVCAAMGTHHMLRRVDLGAIWDALLHDGVTHYAGAPTVQLGLVNHEKAQRLPRPVRVSVAASAPTAHLLAKMEEVGLQPMHVYGSTETYGPITARYVEPEWHALSVDERARLQARQGHAYVAADQTRVVRRPADDAPQGDVLLDVCCDGKEVGEIIVRGNLVMKGYYKDRAATEACAAGGWYHTGDLAVQHAGGEVQVLDRGKDIIISGGENVSSLMVEQELATHQWVSECAVVAHADPKWGEAVHAFVVLNSRGQLAQRAGVSDADAADALRKHCRAYMSGFAVPQIITFVDELPKTSTGKIQKRTLRERTAKL
ncbi:cellulase [Malassezia sp. CBS 17886]|nr:cellulase [Malassezia sp. CBS 17886]